jgi:hypothetical protein
VVRCSLTQCCDRVVISAVKDLGNDSSQGLGTCNWNDSYDARIEALRKLGRKPVQFLIKSLVATRSPGAVGVACRIYQQRPILKKALLLPAGIRKGTDDSWLVFPETLELHMPRKDKR